MNSKQPQLDQVIEYIYIQLDSETEDCLSLDNLCSISGLSKFHFGRIFSAYTGLTVAKFVKRLRLKRASYKLAFHHDEKIIDIAYEAQFDSHEAFSRAFKMLYGQSPKDFRFSPNWQEWHQKNQFTRGQSMQNLDVEVIDFTEQRVALLKHRGAPTKLNHSVAKFIEWRKSNNFSPIASSRTFGLAYHDPATVADHEFKFDICGSINSSIDENPQGVINATIPAGRCAKLVHKGSHDLMGEKIYYLYKEWLATSGENLRDFPCFFEYKNFFPEVSESELITYIYLPIE